MTVIRKAAQPDALEISQLSSQLGYPCSEEETVQFLADLELDPTHCVFVAEIQPGVLAGFGHVFVTKRLFLPAFAELGGLVIDQKCRGTGIGKLLLTEAEGWAKTRDCREIRVRSNIIRTAARDFYLSQGYRDSKQQTVFYKEI